MKAVQQQVVLKMDPGFEPVVGFYTAEELVWGHPNVAVGHMALSAAVFAGMMASVLLSDKILPVVMRKSPQLHPTMETKKTT